MTELKKLVNTIEFTDELIHLNKEYKKVDEICDILESLIEKLDDLDSGLDLKCANAEIKAIAIKYPVLNIEEALKLLTIMESKAMNLHRMIALKSNELLTFQKLGNAISIYKQL